MPLSLETAQTIALGPFNPHIISPGWLFAEKICQDNEVELRFLPMSQGMAFRIRDVDWQIDFHSLMVQSQKVNCGELVAKVVEKLHHTPVHAVGNNFHYSGTVNEWNSRPLPMLGKKGWDSFGGIGTIDQLRWTGTFVENSIRTEVTLGQTEAAIVVLFNFHRNTKGSESAVKAAQQFDDDQKKSKELLEKLFLQEDLS